MERQRKQRPPGVVEALEYATIDELATALRDRVDCYVLAVLEPVRGDSDKMDNLEQHRVWWWGGRTTAIGLLGVTLDDLLEENRRSVRT